MDPSINSFIKSSFYPPLTHPSQPSGCDVSAPTITQTLTDTVGKNTSVTNMIRRCGPLCDSMSFCVCVFVCVCVFIQQLLLISRVLAEMSGVGVPQSPCWPVALKTLDQADLLSSVCTCVCLLWLRFQFGCIFVKRGVTQCSCTCAGAQLDASRSL